MRTKEIVASLVVAATVAGFALVNMNALSPQESFLATPADEVTVAFNNFLAKYQKSYSNMEEYEMRLQAFAANYHFVMNHNMMNTDGSGHTVAINELSDMTLEEVREANGDYHELV